MTVSLRSLATSELGFVGPYPTTAGIYLALRGELDLAALSDAWSAVRQSHPALDATIVERDGGSGGFDFVATGDAPGAPLTVDRPDIYPATFDSPQVDYTTSLGRLHVITAGHRHRLYVSTSHALGDGSYIMSLLSELCAQYTSLVTSGAALPITEHPFPTSAQHILGPIPVDEAQPDGSDAASATPQTVAETGRDRLAGTRWFGAAPRRAAGPPDVTGFNFSAEVTTMLADSAAEIGMNALLSGILLCAERGGYLADSPEAEVPVGAMTLVDMRRRVTPTLEPADVTNFVGASYAATALSMQSNPVDVGRQLAQQTRADLADGRCLAALTNPSAGGGAEPPVVLSNLGKVELSLPTELVALGVSAFVSIDSAAFAVDRAERVVSPSATVYQACTINGRLTIDQITVAGTASAEQRAAVADRIVFLVHAAARLADAA